MILPIVSFGSSILREKCKEINRGYSNLSSLIDDMFETMYEASGVGLAASQVNKTIKLFIIDTTPFTEKENSKVQATKEVFINAKIILEEGDEWLFNEGCLSIPEIREDILRKPKITIEYFDKDFKRNTKTFDGINARVIQHEYDHTDGILFTDRISALRKRMLKGKLNDISKGEIKVGYKMRFSKK
jgi:peptide deformylase|tara:strand:- start:691 stop:1251 length:561 start_codon:yes stop_codon:yes gene_type:complete